MGKNNQTHHDGQVQTVCPGCYRRIRTKPRTVLPDERCVKCGGCGRQFTINDDGDVIEE